MISADLFAVDNPLAAIVILAVLLVIGVSVRQWRGPRDR
jgi:hypothetical protein